MSFSLEVKKELSKLNTLADKKNVKTELLGYMATNNVSVQKNKIRFSTESEYNINRFGKLLNNLGLNDHNIKIQRSVYSITINKNYIEELTENNNDNKSDDLEKAFIRGAFLGSGTINNPEKKYHLECKTRDVNGVKSIVDTMKLNDIILKQRENVLYINSVENLNISSSIIREKIKNNESITNLVTSDIEKYIKENKLYIKKI